MTSQIPFRIDIKPFESGRGYLLRLADQLEYSGPMLIKELAGISYTGPSQSGDLRKLAKLLRQNPAILSEHFYVSANETGSTLQIPFLGQPVHRDHISRGKSRICPKCLVNGRPAQAIWDLCLVTACPDHGCQLVEACFTCGKGLSWLRPRLYQCSCGADLRNMRAPNADVGEIAIASLIQQRVAGRSIDSLSVDFGYCQALNELSLENLLRLVDFIGAKFYRFSNDFSVSYRRRNNPGETRAVLCMAHEVLSNWPSNLHNRLGQIRDKAKASIDDGGVYARAFDAFHRYRFPKGAGLDFLKAEFAQFCGAAGNRPMRLLGDRKEQEQPVWLTPPQAAAMAGDISPAVFHRFARLGILKSKVEHDGERRRGVWLDRRSVAEWLDDAPNWIPLTEAEELLGIRRDVMLRLSHAGLMQTKRGGVPGLMDTRNFRKQDIEHILSAFRRVDAPVVDLCGKANWVVLGKGGCGKALGANAFEQVVAAVCEGRLSPVGKLRPNARLYDYVFDREKINEHIKADLRYSRAELMNRSEVAAFLVISQDVLDALVAENLLTSLPSSGKRVERLFIKRDVSKFADTHVFASHVARSLKTRSADIRKQLSRLGVDGKAISYRYATTVIYRKDEINKFIKILGNR